MELLDKHEKWRSWLVGFSKAFRSKWKKTKDDEAEEKWQILSDYQERLKNAFGDIIEQSEYLISEYSSCGVDWFYQDVLQNCKPSQCVKDCADIVYYEKPQDEKYKGTFLLRLASLIYEKFGFVDGRIYPEPPEPLPDDAEQWQVDDWKEEMDDACSGIVWEEKLECDWLVVYVLIFAFYAALKNEEVLFLVKEGEEAELNGGELTEAAAPTPAVAKKKEKWKNDTLTLEEKKGSTDWRNVFTDRANKYFDKAIEKGWMAEKPEYGYEWTFICEAPEQALAYFSYRVYNKKKPPYKKLGFLFGKIIDPNSNSNPISKNAYKLLHETDWYTQFISNQKKALSTEERNKEWNNLPKWFRDLMRFFNPPKKEDAQ